MHGDTFGVKFLRMGLVHSLFAAGLAAPPELAVVAARSPNAVKSVL